jgi:hypothetical protein
MKFAQPGEAKDCNSLARAEVPCETLDRVSPKSAVTFQ